MSYFTPHTLFWIAAIGQAYTAWEVERNPWKIDGYPRLSYWLTRGCIWGAIVGLLVCVYAAGLSVPL